MSVILTADLHFSDKPRDSYRFEFVPRLKKILKKYDVEALIILGDLTEEKDRHRSWLVNEVVKHLGQLSELCKLYILRGNHDAVDPLYPFFQFTSRLDRGRITWINDPQVLEVSSLGSCCFLPHTNDPEKDWKRVKKSFHETAYIFAHATFKGVRVGKAPPMKGLPLEIFPRDARVYAGDIHAPVSIGCVEYVGAPYTVDFGDDYEPRVVLLDGDEARSIPCQGRQKRLVVVNDIGEISEALERCAGDVVRVRVAMSSESFHDSWRDVVEQVGASARDHGCVLNSVQPLITNALDLEPGGLAVARPTRSDAQLMEDYCARMKVSGTVLRAGKRFL